MVEENVVLQDGSKLVVQKGTQYIDGWWKHLRKSFLQSSKGDIRNVIKQVRSAQWRMWHRGEDLWLKAGEAIHRVAYIPPKD